MSTLIPAFRSRDARAAVEFLCTAFGFERHAVHDGPNGTIAHAELRLGDDVVMLGSAPAPGDDDPFPVRPGGAAVYVVLEGGVDEHCARALAAGAELLYGPRATDYGSREYAVRDPDGNHWSFGTYDPLGG